MACRSFPSAILFTSSCKAPAEDRVSLSKDQKLPLFLILNASQGLLASCLLSIKVAKAGAIVEVICRMDGTSSLSHPFCKRKDIEIAI